MDPYDPERAARLGELIGTLRSRCIRMGAPVALVKMLRVQALLVLYDELLARRERERADLDRLMRQPPAAA